MNVTVTAARTAAAAAIVRARAERTDTSTAWSIMTRATQILVDEHAAAYRGTDSRAVYPATIALHEIRDRTVRAMRLAW